MKNRGATFFLTHGINFHSFFYRPISVCGCNYDINLYEAFSDIVNFEASVARLSNSETPYNSVGSFCRSDAILATISCACRYPRLREGLHLGDFNAMHALANLHSKPPLTTTPDSTKHPLKQNNFVMTEFR